MSAEPDSSSGQIHIEELELFARIGVPEAERAVPQRLIANITLWPVCDLRDLNDDIARTVNYSAVSDEARKFAGEASHKLLETLADRLAGHLLKTFSLRQIMIEVRKFALPKAEYASVTVTRAAAEQ